LRDALRSYADELRIGKGISFAVRMGLNSGEVVVGKIGDDLRMDYTALGHTANLAARMEQIAEPGKIYLAEATAELCQGVFTVRDVGRHEVKGLSQPVSVFELEGVGRVRTRFDVSRARGFSKFVGRTSEMAALESALEQAIAGNAQVVGVVAEPGVGKSRLCHEFLERCRAREVPIYAAHGIPHGKSVPFLPMLDYLRTVFGITDQDSPEAARRKIAGLLLLPDESFREALPMLFDVLGIADPELPAPRMDPEARQRQLFTVIKRITQANGRRAAAVTLFEDLHWFDDVSNAFLEQLVDALPGTKCLRVVTFPPDYPAHSIKNSYSHHLPLLPS